MVQLVKTDARHTIYVATPEDVDGITCQLQLRNLASNNLLYQNATPERQGDWFKFRRVEWDLSRQATGMYLLTIVRVSNNIVFATRLAYLSPSTSTPISTDYDTYNQTQLDAVYQG